MAYFPYRKLSPPCTSSKCLQSNTWLGWHFLLCGPCGPYSWRGTCKRVANGTLYWRACGGVQQAGEPVFHKLHAFFLAVTQGKSREEDGVSRWSLHVMWSACKLRGVSQIKGLGWLLSASMGTLQEFSSPLRPSLKFLSTWMHWLKMEKMHNVVFFSSARFFLAP